MDNLFKKSKLNQEDVTIDGFFKDFDEIEKLFAEKEGESEEPDKFLFDDLDEPGEIEESDKFLFDDLDDIGELSEDDIEELLNTDEEFDELDEDGFEGFDNLEDSDLEDDGELLDF